MFRRFQLFGFFILALAGTIFALPLHGQSQAKTLNLDAKESRLLIHVGSGGVFGSFGHPHILEATDVVGQVLFDPDQVERSSMTLKVRADSLTVIDKESQKDKEKIEKDMKEKVLETSSHPEITFKSTQVVPRKVEGGNYEIHMEGDLNLHGVTKKVGLDVKVTRLDSGLTAKGETVIKQTDFGIKPLSVAGGTVKVKNEVRLTFEMTAL